MCRGYWPPCLQSLFVPSTVGMSSQEAFLRVENGYRMPFRVPRHHTADALLAQGP